MDPLRVLWRLEVDSNGVGGPKTHWKVCLGLGVVLVGTSGLLVTSNDQQSTSCSSLVDFPPIRFMMCLKTFLYAPQWSLLLELEPTQSEKVFLEP